MSDKTVKKNIGFLYKKANKLTVDVSYGDCTPYESSNVPKTPPPVIVKKRNSITAAAQKGKRLSTGGILDLVQCPICLDKLSNAKMLPCQHTFCCGCLKGYVQDNPKFSCPMCQTVYKCETPNYIEKLPANLYIDSILTLLGNVDSGSSESNLDKSVSDSPTEKNKMRCSVCKSICSYVDVNCCNHCKLSFCTVCWSQHIQDLKTQIGSIRRQLESAETRLEHKMENFKDRCEHLMELINTVAERKVQEIMSKKLQLLEEANNIQDRGTNKGIEMKVRMADTKTTAILSSDTENFDNIRNDNEKISTFMNLHKATLEIINDVSKWDDVKFYFDKEEFSIDEDLNTPSEAEADDPDPMCAKGQNPLESDDNLILHYRSRHFIPSSVWRKCPRPAGVAIGPWFGHMYVCGTDSHHVLVIDRSKGKIITRLMSPDMLCPTQIAFLKTRGEIYVTDKWKHCVHVFSKEWEYKRCIGSKGNRLGSFRSPEGIITDQANNNIYIADTGNDRVQVIQPDGTVVGQIGVMNKSQNHSSLPSMWNLVDVKCTELNAPTSIALTTDRVIVLDSGNRRVKVYTKLGEKIHEFGSFGIQKGQFRQPEVLVTDPLGFILVGDSGNSRVQVFKPTGQLVRVFGGFGQSPGKFGWISGIFITKQLDVIISDTKNHQVSVF